jgi:hypothetical protein
MGGPSVETCYYLGRILQQNLFRKSNAAVLKLAKSFIAKRTSAAGVALLEDGQAWDIAALLTRHQFELQTLGRSGQNRKVVAAVEAFLTNPKISTAALAQAAGTTEKHLARMSLLTATRASLARRREARRRPS